MIETGPNDTFEQINESDFEANLIWMERYLAYIAVDVKTADYKREEAIAESLDLNDIKRRILKSGEEDWKNNPPYYKALMYAYYDQR